MSASQNRRSFLRGLVTLPLIGEGVTLIGQPAGAAERLACCKPYPISPDQIIAIDLPIRGNELKRLLDLVKDEELRVFLKRMHADHASAASEEARP